jgi:hypothetical protein
VNDLSQVASGAGHWTEAPRAEESDSERTALRRRGLKKAVGTGRHRHAALLVSVLLALATVSLPPRFTSFQRE